MPMIGKREFIPQSNPLPLPDEVYYNDVTNEIFTEYEPYLRRIDDINQRKWTCSITGKTGLTFQEACHSEDDAHATIHTIPEVLRKVLAVLMTHIKISSTPIAITLLYEFTNLRYFIGEEVQLLSPGRRRQDVTILKVFAPENVSGSKGTISYGLDPLAHEYLIRVEEAKNKFVELKLPASRLTRHKGRLTREKIRLFLKTGLAIQKNRFDPLVFRDDFCKEIGLSNIKWTDIFAGPEPNFTVDTTVVKALGKKEAAENLGPLDLKSSKTKKPKPKILKKKSNILAKSKKNIQDLKKKKAVKKTIDKEKIKENLREAKKLYEENMKVWSEKRDDLLCDDLKPLPESLPIDIDFDLRHLKDVFMITEFVNTFASYIQNFNDYFPDGISFQKMLEILEDTEIGGSYGALVQTIFSTILNSHFEGRKDDKKDIEIDNNLEMDLDIIADENVESNVSSNFTNFWVTTYFNTHEQLAKLKLNQFTLSELLRIYILKVREVDRKTGKRSELSDMELKLIKSLTVKSFFELDLEERLDLFDILIQDFFSITEVIEKIDETNQDIYKLRIEIRHLNSAHTKWLREHPIRNRIRKKKSAETNSVPDEASPEEKEAYRVEKAEREEQLLQQIGSMKAQIRKLSLFSREFCLGEDRAFRKYWIFQFIPGIFVEHVPPQQLEFPCLESPVPAKKPVMADYLENSAKRKSRKNNTKNEQSTSPEPIELERDGVDRCTGDMSTCTIHGNAPSGKPLWTMYAKHHVDPLIEALNARGNRESELRTALEYERKTIMTDNLAHFDPVLFNPNYVEPPPTPPPKQEESEVDEILLENETRKSARILKNIAIEKANLNSNNNHVEKPTVRRKIPKLIAAKYQNMESDQSHLRAFYDKLAKFADKIILANFSTFDDANWQKWNEQLNTCLDNLDQPNEAIKMLIELFKSLAMSLKSFCLLPPLVVTLDPSNLNSPSDKENIEVRTSKENVISDKWLELLKLISQEDRPEDDPADIEASYGLSTISQLFVNYSILKRSLNWSLSAERTASRCKGCKRRIGALAERVICDRCNCGYHTSCLKLRPSEDLKSNWSCNDCLPRNNTSPVAESNESISEDFVEEKCGYCNYALKTNENDVHCRDCNKNFHLACSGLTRATRAQWTCKKCVSKQKRRKESADVDVSSGDHEIRRSGRKRRTLVYSDNDDDDYEY